MPTIQLTFIIFTITTSHFTTTTISHRPLSGNHHCNSPPQKPLQPNQFTVLINGYSESRIPILQTLTNIYSTSPSISSIVILWSNPNTPTQTLTHLSHNLSTSSPGESPIYVVRQRSDSLNERFVPWPWIETRGVVICDDDVEVDLKSVEFAFSVWRSDEERAVGLFVRSHELDLVSRSWIYTMHPDRYSILLTKFMIIKTEYLHRYTCEGGEPMTQARSIVDKMRNCEDILMNFVIANATGKGPTLVGGKRVRDWGDARNEVGRGLMAMTEEGAVVVGLSSRKKDHRKRRGDCIREFHRVLGKMPLRYSYGKMVDSVGEQGLCEKGGKLVFCDQQ